MLKRLLETSLRVLKVFIGALLAAWIISFDPPIREFCGFVGCQPVYSHAHWSSVLLFFVAASLLVHEFWQIVRSLPLAPPEKPAHVLSAPHTGLGSFTWYPYGHLHEPDYYPRYAYCLDGWRLDTGDCAT
ncbi:MAG: hypothetical protein AAGF72_17085 [Pseudomonadota bacterium]